MEIGAHTKRPVLILGELQTASVGLEVAKALMEAKPFDLEEVDLADYRALEPEWQDWNRIEAICHDFGSLLGQKLITEYEPSTSENN
jgi:hypothetical protein